MSALSEQECQNELLKNIYLNSRGADSEILKGGASQVNSHNEPEKIQNRLKFGTRFYDGLRSYLTKIHQGQFSYHVFKL